MELRPKIAQISIVIKQIFLQQLHRVDKTGYDAADYMLEVHRLPCALGRIQAIMISTVNTDAKVSFLDVASLVDDMTSLLTSDQSEYTLTLHIGTHINVEPHHGCSSSHNTA